MGKTKDVIVIEDNVSLAVDWGLELERRDYDVTYCSDIQSGIQACLDNWPDAIILDAFFSKAPCSYGGNGGAAFCSEILEISRRLDRRLPVIIGVSGAKPSTSDPQEVFCAVSHAHMPLRIQKPICKEELADKLEQQLFDCVQFDRSQLNLNL